MIIDLWEENIKECLKVEVFWKELIVFELELLEVNVIKDEKFEEV